MGRWLDKDYWRKIGLLKENFAGEKIPSAAGLLFILFSVISWSGYSLLLKTHAPQRLIFLITIIGAISLLDDMVGTKENQGFSGHFRLLLKGRLTTGALKAIVSFLAVVMIIEGRNNRTEFFLDAGLILLMTNFINLLDLRPGRALKVFILLAVLITITVPPTFFYIGPALLLALPYLPYELKQKVMLGDTGANFLGALLGYTMSRTLPAGDKLVIILVLFLLTILSERYSYSRIIEANPFLKWLDQLGR